MRFYNGIGIAFVVFVFLQVFHASTVFAGACDYCVCDDGTVKPSCTDCCKKPETVTIGSIGNSKLESIEKRLDAIEKTMENFLEILGKWQTTERCSTVGCNCHIVKTCVAVSCTSYDEHGKCLNQICVAWEEKFVCD